MISQIIAYNQGLAFNVRLGQKNLIVGPNGSGKTALIRAVRLALVGSLPEMGKTNAALWPLATNGRLSAQVLLKNGDEYSRSWHEGKDGIEQKKNVPRDEPFADVPLLSPAAYFSLSATERTKYVFSRTQMPEGYDQQRVLKEIDKVIADSDDVTTDDEDAAAEAERIAAEVMINSDTLTEALTILTDDKKGPLKAEFTKYNKEATETKGALSTVTKLRASEHATTEDNLKGMEAQVKELEGKRTELERELGKLEGRREAIDKHRKRIEELNRMLAEPLVDYAAKIAECEKEMQAIKDQKKPGQLERDAIHDLRMKYGAKREEMMQANAELERLRDKEAELRRSLEEWEHIQSCPSCGSNKEHWMNAPEKSVRESLVLLEPNVIATANVFAALGQECDQLSAQIRVHEDAYEHNCQLAIKFEEWNRQRTHHKQWLEKQETGRAQLKKELETLTGAKGEEAPDEEQMNELREGINKHTQAITELRTKIKASTELHANLKIAEQSLAKHNRAKAFANVLKKARENLVKLQAEMVGVVFGGITERANRILGDLLPTPLVFKDDTVGRMAGEQFVSIDTFSGMEEAIAFVAIAAALSAGAPLRVLMLDELSRCTPSVQGEIIKRLSAAVDRGELDQILLALPREKKLNAVPEGWTVIETAPLAA